MDPAVAASGLKVLRELLAAHRSELKQLLDSTRVGQSVEQQNEDDDEEHFADEDAIPKSDVPDERAELYRPLAREPRFANSRQTPVWELHALSCHIHPCIAHNASFLLRAESYDDVGSDPFREFSCGELLEQFAYAERTPRTRRGEKGQARVPYNSEKFSRRKYVAPHERFFQMYFSDKTVRRIQQKKASRRNVDEDDIDEDETVGTGVAAEEDEEEDRFFEQHVKEMMPKADLEDSDADPDMDDDSELELDGEDSDGSFAGLDDADSQDGEEDIGDEDDRDDMGEAHDKAKKGAKRRLELEDIHTLSRGKRAKAIKEISGGGHFASADDFEQLLAQDGGGYD